MTIDKGEINYNDIRSSVNLEKYTPKRLAELWREAFGEAGQNKIRREKFKNVGGRLTISDDTILEEASLTTVGDLSLLFWKKGDVRMEFRIKEGSFVGIQNHDGGEKSVVVQSSTDRESGAFKQTTRRFTAT